MKVLFLLVGLSVSAFSADPTENKFEVGKAWHELEKKEERINSYIAEYIFASYIRLDQPSVQIIHIDVMDKRDPSKIKSKLLFVLSSRETEVERLSYKGKLASRINFTPDKILIHESPEGGERKEEGEGDIGELIRFDSVGSGGKLINSVWRSKKTGFVMREILYDDAEKPITQKIFIRFSREQDDRGKESAAKFRSMSYGSLSKTLIAEANLSEVNNLFKFVRKLALEPEREHHGRGRD